MYRLETIQGESKKKCDLRRLVQKCTFFRAIRAIMEIFQYFLNFFFGTPIAKKNPRTFFLSQNQKFRKAKMCILTNSIEI